jgi:alpha-glucosidase
MSQGTRCRQLAEYIVFDSPLNMLCDSPSNYIREQECTDFITAVPTVWAETVALEGRIGDFETIARLSYAGDWYVGSLASWNGRDAGLDLSFLPEGRYKAEIFCDGVNASRNANDYKHVMTEVSSGETIRIRMAPGGGYAIKFSKL